MSRFQIFRDNILLKQLELDPSKVYVAGRKETCDIILDHSSGISREHFKLIFVDGYWVVDLISRYGEIYINNEKVNKVDLIEDTQFAIPPFEFKFFLQEKEEVKSLSENFDSFSDKTTLATVVTSSSYVPFIKIMDHNNEVQELLRLDSGNNWLAGRDSNCHIQIRDLRVSRQQFEIQQIGNQFYILDSGSVNGTFLNGSRVSSSEPYPIRSGDAISVLDNYFYFELHDQKFQERLLQVNYENLNLGEEDFKHESEPFSMVPVSNQLNIQTIHSEQEVQNNEIDFGTTEKIQNKKSEKLDLKKHYKLIAISVVLLLLIYLMTDNSSKKAAKSPAQGSQMNSSEFSKLPREKQLLVKQSYQLAKNLYIQQKFQLAQTELDKISDYVKDDPEINQLSRLVNEGMVLQQQVRANEIAEQQKIEIEEKITSQVQLCKKKIHSNITSEEIEDCLAPIIQFNPEHPEIVELKSQVEQIVMNRQAKESERALYQEKVARLRRFFTDAEGLERKKDLLVAIKAYEKVIFSELPDPHRLKIVSRGRVAKIKKDINQKIVELNKVANKFAASKMFRQAILKLREAKKVDPENQSLDDQISSYTLELKNLMAVIYQEAVLEENFGNVEGSEGRPGAKQKWKKIVELDIEEGEYFRKAKIKLKKYGDL